MPELDLTLTQLQILRGCVLRSRRQESGRAAFQAKEAAELRDIAKRSAFPDLCRENAASHEATRTQFINRAEALKVLLGKIEQVLGEAGVSSSRL